MEQLSSARMVAQEVDRRVYYYSWNLRQADYLMNTIQLLEPVLQPGIFVGVCGI